jgi:hypothetical protein
LCREGWQSSCCDHSVFSYRTNGGIPRKSSRHRQTTKQVIRGSSRRCHDGWWFEKKQFMRIVEWWWWDLKFYWKMCMDFLNDATTNWKESSRTYRSRIDKILLVPLRKQKRYDGMMDDDWKTFAHCIPMVDFAGSNWTEKSFERTVANIFWMPLQLQRRHATVEMTYHCYDKVKKYTKKTIAGAGRIWTFETLKIIKERCW